MENNIQKLTDAELLKAAAHITVDPCDPSQDAMAETLAELSRRYAALVGEMGIPADMQPPLVDNPTARDIYEAERRPYRLLPNHRLGHAEK